MEKKTKAYKFGYKLGKVCAWIVGFWISLIGIAFLVWLSKTLIQAIFN